MSERPEDELLALYTSTTSLTDKINESDDAITKINQIVKGLVPEQEHSRLSQDEGEEATTTTTHAKDSDDEMKQLQQQRLQLVMELQKQDYISSKLQELVKENQELLDTIKDYISK